MKTTDYAKNPIQRLTKMLKILREGKGRNDLHLALYRRKQNR